MHLSSAIMHLSIVMPVYDETDNVARLTLPRFVKHWSLTTRREKFAKIGAKVTRHSKCVTFQLAEMAVTRNGKLDANLPNEPTFSTPHTRDCELDHHGAKTNQQAAKHPFHSTLSEHMFRDAHQARLLAPRPKECQI